jgi:hypothetical protein
LISKKDDSIQPMTAYSQKKYSFSKINNIEVNSSIKWWLFIVFLALLITDRVITLLHFGFIYTDIDQMVLWNGAYDYARGIFHEPYFYGQPYNYMLESFLSLPFLWMHIPVYIALPITTSIISLLPYIILALFFNKRGQSFWACLCLAFPLLMPVQYSFLTTISRGFVQALFFVPLLYIPLFDPRNKRKITVLYLASAICFIANQMSLLIVLPIVLYVYTFHFRSFSFYVKSLWVIPIIAADYFAKYFYKMYPERVLHLFAGIEPDSQTFLKSFHNVHHFDYLFPFCSGWGIVYPVLFILLAILALARSMKKEFLFIFSILTLLLITFSIPKVQEYIPYAGIFFTSSRHYLYLPVLLIITLFFIFQRSSVKTMPVIVLIIVSAGAFITRNFNIQETVQKTISQTIFPVAKNQDLINRANELKCLSQKYDLDLIVHTTFDKFSYVFDSYAYNPLTQNNFNKTEKTISVNLDGDRRTWLFNNSTHCKQILLNGIKVDTSLLKGLDYKIINSRQIVIKNNTLNVPDLFDRLNLKFGN